MEGKVPPPPCNVCYTRRVSVLCLFRVRDTFSTYVSSYTSVVELKSLRHKSNVIK